ncbi:MAG: hypothetical protein MJZ47_02835 [Bacteroidales bacterium]|nr:hypothetical protein [Bacteroidales bacterium]
MASKINVPKGSPLEVHAQSDHIQEMENAISSFFAKLEKPNEQFDPEGTFDALLNYITIYERILYSTISNIIYKRYADSGKADVSGTLLSNLDALVRYSETSENIAAKKKALTGGQTEDNVDQTRKAIIKIWDHITLASHQYTMLKQTDDEYDEKFQKRIATYKEEMSKEMNTQMITMVGIFTALAFLIFGSISSLDGIFENIELPLFKTLSIGLIWGLCVSNMIFVFLYCIGKMTKLNFKANDKADATIFERYPVVWWTNLVLVSLLLLSAWGWFVQQNSMGQILAQMFNCKPWLCFVIGSVVILILIIVGIVFLCKKTKHKEVD